MSTFPVFVDNIPASVQTKELRQLFSKCGRVTEVTLLPDNKGFVNYACPDDAMDATIRFRNYPFCGKKLFVTSSKELDEFIHQRDGPTTREYLEHRDLKFNSLKRFYTTSFVILTRSTYVQQNFRIFLGRDAF